MAPSSTLLRLVFGTAVALPVSPLLSAQTAQVTGIITDPRKDRMQGVKVVVTNTRTGISRDAVSNGEGNYSLPLLYPGRYQLIATADGFRPLSREGILLEADRIARIDIIMEIGPVTETMEVSASTPVVELVRGSLGQLIESKQFSDMPLNDRGALALVALSGGVSLSRQFSPNDFLYANLFSATGSRAGQNEFQLDGAPNTLPDIWPGRATLGTPVQVDAVQEVMVQTCALPAEFGRTGGGLVNIVTRSGSKQWHGAVFEYLRNSALDANNFFNNRAGIPRGAFRRNQFGGSWSGPLRLPARRAERDRTFFFLSYQGTRAAIAQTQTWTVPTAATRAGDFSGLVTPQGATVLIYDPLTTTTVNGDPRRQPFPDNVIPAGRVDPAGRSIASYYPLPNLPGAVNNFLLSDSDKPDNGLSGVRIDHAFASAHQLFARFNRTRVRQRFAQAFHNAAEGIIGWDQGIDGVAADYTWAVGASAVLGLRYGITNRADSYIDPALGLDLTSLGFPAAVNRAAAFHVFPGVNPAGYGVMGDSIGVNDYSYRTQSIQQSATKLVAVHTLKAGADVRFNHVHQERGIDPSGTYNFTRSFTQGPDANRGGAAAGDAIASLLVGAASSGRFGTRVLAASRNEYYGVYVQDDWKATPKLTLNLGLRYELEMPRWESANRLDWFDYGAVSPLTGSVSGLGTLRGGLRFAGLNGNPRRQFNTDGTNFAPRFGFAWQIGSRTVVRGGAGVFYGAGSIGAGGFNTNSQAFSPSTPFVGSLDGLRPLNTLSDPFPDGFAEARGSAEGLLSQVGMAIPRVYDRGAALPYNLQWNATVQRQVGSYALQVSYAASRGIHLTDGAGIEINQLRPEALRLGAALNELVPNPFYGAIAAPGALRNQEISRGQLLRPYPQFDSLTVFNPSSAASTYHAAVLKVERRFASGFGLLASWTASKNISDAPAAIGPFAGHQNSYDRRSDRSLVEEDVSQRFVASATYELPVGRGKPLGAGWSRLPETLLGGWEVNVIAVRQTGFPLAITNSTDTLHALGGVGRPDSRGFSAAKTGPVQSRLNAYLEAAAFAAPEPFAYGNLGRTLPDVRGPGLSNIDLSLVKTFALTELLRLQFRCEAFNLTNSPMFALPDQSFGAPAFGTITAQQNIPRQLQFALRLFF